MYYSFSVTLSKNTSCQLDHYRFWKLKQDKRYTLFFDFTELLFVKSLQNYEIYSIKYRTLSYSVMKINIDGFCL